MQRYVSLFFLVIGVIAVLFGSYMVIGALFEMNTPIVVGVLAIIIGIFNIIAARFLSKIAR